MILPISAFQVAVITCKRHHACPLPIIMQENYLDLCRLVFISRMTFGQFMLAFLELSGGKSVSLLNLSQKAEKQ
jgi:hypothetical protein